MKGDRKVKHVALLVVIVFFGILQNRFLLLPEMCFSNFTIVTEKLDTFGMGYEYNDFFGTFFVINVLFLPRDRVFFQSRLSEYKGWPRLKYQF